MEPKPAILSQPWRSSRAAELCFALWVSVHIGAIASVYLPGPLGGGRLPWSMFATQTPNSARVFAQVEVNGVWEEVPLDSWFSYRRGATEFSLVHEHPGLKGPGSPARKDELARWIAHRLAGEGRPPTRVRLGRRITPLGGGPVREVELGLFEVSP